MNQLRALERYAKPRSAEERCDLCATAIPEAHPHVVDVQDRRLCCACYPCSVLFRDEAAGGGRFQTVPERVLVDPLFRVPIERWDALDVPVHLAFLFRNSAMGKWVAVYPSPGGPTEMVLEVEALAPILGPSPLLEAVAPDVEALLFHGERGAVELGCVLAPIDRCYALVSIVRKTWRGFDGGDARGFIAEFIQGLHSEAKETRR